MATVTVYTVLGRAFALSRMLQKYPNKDIIALPIHQKFEQAYGDDAAYLYDKLRYDCCDMVDEWIAALDPHNETIFFTHPAFAR